MEYINHSLSVQFSSSLCLLQPGSHHICKTPSLLTALEAANQAAEASDDARGLLSSQLSLFSSSSSGHQIGKGLAVVLLVVVEDQSGRSASLSSFGDQVADVD